MNRDEAERCLDIAEDAEKQGNIEKALKFYEKSMKLCPNFKAEQAIERLKSKPQGTSEPNLRQRSSHSSTNSNSNSNSTSETNSSKKYTKEQEEAVARIIKCTDYYEILSVSKTSTEEEIKRSYKKLALQMHPDKNQAPGAEDAFKKIGQAFSCLNDPQKRKLYDLRGSEEPASPTMRTRHEWDSDLTPEEIFSMFFGGGIPMRRAGGAGGSPYFRTYTYSTSPRGFRRGFNSEDEDLFYQQRPRRTSTRQTASEPSIIFTFLQFLPLLLLIFYAFLSSPTNDPQYQFSKSATYNQEMTTEKYQFNYYVKSNEEFDKSKVDKQVEKAFINYLQENCYQETVKERVYGVKAEKKSCKEMESRGIQMPKGWRL